MATRIGMLLADLHFGAVEVSHFAEELYDIIKTIRRTPQLDYIVFLGDIFDRKMYIGDPHIKNLVVFIRSIMTIAIERKIKVRMIYGTESHECDQYIIFKGYEEIDSLDFKIIREVCEEDLFDDLKVLYIPEEYITCSKTEYYQAYFTKDCEYDYVFGHGVIMEGMIMVKNDQTAQGMTSKSPKFTISDFDRCLLGEVYFGHFHVHSDVTDRIHYVGSYSRWKHDEETEKGYVLITKTRNKYTHDFIENGSAIMYKTISFGYEHSIFTESDNLELCISGIDRIISVYPEGSRIKLRFNIPETYPNPEFFMEYVKEKYRMNSLIILEFVNGYVDAKKRQDREEIRNTIKRYNYVLNKGNDIGETVSKFVKDKRGKEISPDRVTFYLTQNLQDILNTVEL